MSKYTAKSALRTVKNYTKGYSDIQVKVREATSNDPWGPSGALMSEIAQATYDLYLFQEIIEILDKRLNDKGKNWRHVFKALTLLDYMLHSGSHHVVKWGKENVYLVKTLCEFQYRDDDDRDHGANVRQKARDVTYLLMNDERLREERQSRANMRDRLAGRAQSVQPESSTAATSRPIIQPDFDDEYDYEDEDEELRKAIEESKKTAAEYELRHRRSEEDLLKALELSRKEAANRENAVAQENELIITHDLDVHQNVNSPFAAVEPYNPYAVQQQPSFAGVGPANPFSGLVSPPGHGYSASFSSPSQPVEYNPFAGMLPNVQPQQQQTIGEATMSLVPVPEFQRRLTHSSSLQNLKQTPTISSSAFPKQSSKNPFLENGGSAANEPLGFSPSLNELAFHPQQQPFRRFDHGFV